MLTITLGPIDPGFLAAAWLTLILFGVYLVSMVERSSLTRQADRMRKALEGIVDCETPKSNGTVRRMADIAYDGLGR